MKKELILFIEQKEFKNDKNENVKYFDLRVKLNNRTFIVRPLDKDKKFFNYLLSEIMILEK